GGDVTGPSVSDERAASAPDRRAWPLVVELTAPAASDPGLVGAKAASLARAAAAGLPVLPGAVLTTAATARWKPGEEPDDEVLDEARRAWERLGGEGRAFVVRSSSTIEDTAHSSMAGRFRSVLDVRGWAAMRAAIAAVRDSARRVPGPDGGPAPLAVLLQPQLPTRCGGVLFGLDPVDGDRRHLVAEYVEDNPDAVVSGRATATRIVLSRHGRQLDRDGDAAPLG